MQENWFESWFDTEFYHKLYRNRNEEEADDFIDKLLNFLHLKPHSKILDCACGKGRHAKLFHMHNMQVEAFDLSPKSIEFAKTFEAENLQFYIHDIRKVFRTNYFDLVSNLFTSFGYFQNKKDDEAAFRSFYLAAKPQGYIVLDYLNSHGIINNLDTNTNSQTIEDILFNSSKKIVDNFVIKDIEVFDTKTNQKYNFQEQVKLITESDFVHLFQKFGLKKIAHFGNYQLETYSENTSNRFIAVYQKI